MIVTAGGENVQPETVEDAYLQHPAIAEIAVFERDGKIVGLIVPKAGPKGGTDAQEGIRRAVSEVSQTLPSYQRLAAYAVTRETIPRTRLGKPRRHLLEDLYDQALRGEPGATPERRGPMPLDEMSADDRALLEDPVARQAWDWLAHRLSARYPTRLPSRCEGLRATTLRHYSISIPSRRAGDRGRTQSPAWSRRALPPRSNG